MVYKPTNITGGAQPCNYGLYMDEVTMLESQDGKTDRRFDAAHIWVV